MSLHKGYLLGPMTGHDDYNRQAFIDAAGDLRDRGYEIVSPVELDGDTELSWGEYLARDLRIILTDPDLDFMVALVGWHLSNGAQIEAVTGLLRRDRRLPMFQYVPGEQMIPLPITVGWQKVFEI